MALPSKKKSHLFETQPSALPFRQHFFTAVVVEQVDDVEQVVAVFVVVDVVGLFVVVVVVHLVVVLVVDVDVDFVVVVDVVVVVVVSVVVVVVVVVNVVSVVVVVVDVVEVVVEVDVEAVVEQGQMISCTFSSLNCKSICNLIISFKVWSTLRLISFMSLLSCLPSSAFTT